MPENINNEELISEKELLEIFNSQFATADLALKEIRDSGFTWDEREKLFAGIYKDSEEKTEAKNILSTGELTTLAMDGSCRVMAQMPSGRFYNKDGKTGASMLMNLLFEHYVVPNAVTGGAMLLKNRLVNLYSRIYPYTLTFIDWVFRGDYVGPDPVIIHPRRFRPQPGKTAIEDMDYCFVDVEVSESWLKERDRKFWKNVDEILKNHEEGSGTPEEDRSSEERGKTRKGFTLKNRFESNGDWTVVCDGKLMVHEKEYWAGIPISMKRQYPRIDQLAALNDFDRGQSNQKAIDSLVRMLLDGIAMSIDPPLVMDPEQVILSSIIRQPKAKWFVKNGASNAITPQTISPRGLESFQSFYGTLKANLMSLGASGDPILSKGEDVGFGKTPQALKMQGEKQGARDVWDISMMEMFIERQYTIIADMLAKKGVSEYAFRLLGTSIEKIKEQYPSEDFSGLLEREDGMIAINPEYIRGEYRYIVDPGSMQLKKDETGEKMMSLIELYGKYPEIRADLEANGEKVNFGEAFKRVVIDSGIQDWDKIIIKNENPENIEGIGDEASTINYQNVTPEQELINQGIDINQ